ncbi:unnamed protein product [Moneuplotes crassus]|uniref:Uncharacterized protein n=1 Tax=Euplotes crassus TaxID=5936 RepID=A0AAD1XM89_EUPCR|nr:unnamed protein product [Moneuplotes crassus]
MKAHDVYNESAAIRQDRLQAIIYVRSQSLKLDVNNRLKLQTG